MFNVCIYVYIYIYIYVYIYIYIYIHILHVYSQGGLAIISATYMSESSLETKNALEMGIGHSFMFSQFPKHRLLK